VLRRAWAELQVRGVSDGHRPATPRRSGMEGSVLALAASGLGVPEIAQRLFLTPGTVAAVLAGAEASSLKFLSSSATDAVHP
jgi:DNA-binding NarL/FixJ family response regulator